jgi:hypothetical protein
MTMISESDVSRHEGGSPRLESGDLAEIRSRIMADAKRGVDRHRTGFNPTMLTDDDTNFFNTDDVAFRDWWDWIEQIIRSISDGLTRVALGVTAAGFAIAASHMYASPEGAKFAGPTLGAAVLLVAWQLVSTGASMRRR